MLKRLHFVLSLLMVASMTLVPIVTAQEATPIVNSGNSGNEQVVSLGEGDEGASEDLPASDEGSGSPDAGGDQDASTPAGPGEGDNDPTLTDPVVPDDPQEGSPSQPSLPDDGLDGVDNNNVPSLHTAGGLSSFSLDDELYPVTFTFTHEGGASLQGGAIDIRQEDNQIAYEYFGSSGLLTIDLPAGDYVYNAYSWAWGFGSIYDVPLRVSPDGNEPQAIQFPALRIVTVKVVDENGNPISGASVDFGSYAGGQFDWSNPQSTNSQGLATVALDETVTHYRVRATGPWQETSGELTFVDQQILVLTPETDTVPVTFNLTHSNNTERPFESGSVSLYGQYPLTLSSLLTVDSSGSVETALPIGSYSYYAESDTDGYESYSGEFTVDSNDSHKALDAVLVAWPWVNAIVTDSDGNPMPNVLVEFGYWNGDSFHYFRAEWTDQDGKISRPVNPATESWRVAPFGIWAEHTGAIITDDVLPIEISDQVPHGTITFNQAPDDYQSVSFDLTRADGFTIYLNVDNTAPSVSSEVPEGTYTWTARGDSQYVRQTGTFTISADDARSVDLESWVLHPELTITITDQNGDPVKNTWVDIEPDQGYEGWSSGVTDESGTLVLNVPYGMYGVNVHPPAKYAPISSFIETFTETRTMWPIDAVVLPHGSLTINLIGSAPTSEYRYVYLYQGTGDDERQIASGYVWVYGDADRQVTLEGVPYGGNYVIKVDGSFWFKPYESASTTFDENSGVFDVAPEALPTVQVNVTATTEDPGRTFPRSTSLRFYSSNSSGNVDVYLEPNDDGALVGTATIPARPYDLAMNATDAGYQAVGLQSPLDLTNVTSPYDLNFQIAMGDFGQVVFEVSVPDGLTPAGTILIQKDGQIFTSNDVYSNTVSFYSLFPPGHYTWQYTPTGAFLPESGEFTVANMDLEIPLNLRTGQNGVVHVTIDFPMDKESSGGSLTLLDQEGKYVAGRSLTGSGVYAVGPILYGTYTLEVFPYDGSLVPVTFEVVVDRNLVEKNVVLSAWPTRTVTVNVSGNGMDPVDGWIQIRDDNYNWVIQRMSAFGSFSLEVPIREDTTYVYVVGGLNYEQKTGSWDGVSASIDVDLGEPRPTTEVHFVNEEGEPAAASFSWYGCDTESWWPSADVALFFALDGNISTCEMHLTDHTGVYKTADVTLDFTATTPQVVTLARNENLVQNITFILDFEGGVPDGEIYLSVSGRTLYSFQQGLADENGKVTFSWLPAGEYSLYVSVNDGSAFARYDGVPLPETLNVTSSNQEETLHVSKVKTSVVTVHVVDQDGSPVTSGQIVFPQGKGGGLGPYAVTGSPMVIELPYGIWSASVRSGLYADAYQEFEVKEGTTDVVVKLTSIVSVPVTGEPTEPGETPTVPGETPTVPGETPTVPGETPTVPGETPTVPGETPTIPVETPTDPGETPTVPGETPTVPVETPTQQPTQTPTEEPEGEQQLIVQFELPGDANISGAPFELWAPTAATFLTGPLYTGVVGPNNTIVIDGLVPGKYRLVVYPEGMEAIEAVIQVGSAPVTQVLVQVDDDGDVEVTYLETETPTVSPTDPAPTTTAAADGDVSALPSTGAGQPGNPLTPMFAMLAAAAVLTLITGVGVKRAAHKR